MTRYQAFRGAHVTGHAFWWVFVVAALLARGRFDGEHDEFGWTAYAVDAPRRYADYVPSEGFRSTGSIAAVAFVVLMSSALVEAVCVRPILARIVTVAVPHSGFGCSWIATVSPARKL